MKRARLLAIGLVALTLVAQPLAVAAAAGGVSFSDDSPAPNPEVSVNVTKSTHMMEWSDDLAYENDNGEKATLNAAVNDSYDNPYWYTASDVNATDFDAFPHDKSDVSALDAGEWTTSGATVSNVETGPGVDAVNFATSGSLTSGGSESATFSNFSVTSDESKRTLQLVLDVVSIDSGASLEVRIVDEDGDYKMAEINTSRSSGEDYIASATGEGIVYQAQLGKLDTMGSGDGTFDNIQKVELVAQDADVEVNIAGLNVEKMGMWDFGDTRMDTDGDDELESTSVMENKDGGAIMVESLDTLGDTFSQAYINDLTIAVDFRASDLEDEDVMLETEMTDAYPGYAGTATIYYRLSLPAQYDLSYSDATLTDEQSVTSDRVMSVEYAEGTADTEFGNISSYSDITGQYGTEGTEVTVDETIQSGQSLVIKYKFKFTESQFDAIEASSGGAAGPAKAPGGIDLPFIGAIGGIIGGLFLFIRRLRG